MVDRCDAQEISDMVGVSVEAVPEDFDTMTADVWQVFLGDVDMPESPDERWQLLQKVLAGLL